jgi:probable HAF family extracellular repeat protein
MKTIMNWIAASSLLAAQAFAQQATHYTVTDLGAVGGGQPYFVDNFGLVSGSASSSTIMHAVLWYGGNKLDIGSRGLGGPNSAAFGVNDLAQVVGEAETAVSNHEDFCGFNAYGFPSSTACLPFLWQNGVMTPLPTLGGANGVANWINNRGQVAGYAENRTQDPGCPVFEFKPVIWQYGKIEQLPTYGGDPVGGALAINDLGQAVGISGPCAAFNPGLGLYLVDAHALLWENGRATDLGNLGGTDGLFGGNHACAINNLGQVVGHSDLTGYTTFHAYIWTRQTGKMTDLGTLPGDFASAALSINDGGKVVGASFDANFNSRAVIWQNGVITDLNKLIPANSALQLQQAKSINASGQIAGFGVNGSGEIHGFLATPR